MKRMSILRIFLVLLTATAIFAACTKESSDVRLTPRLSTTQVLNVKSDSATVVAFVVASGDGFSERGVCYNTSKEPTVLHNKAVYSSTVTGSTFKVKIGGLNYATKYYARAYAITGYGTIYGEEVTFTTLPVVPVVTTAPVTSVTGTTAAGGGNVTASGGSDVTERGVCFSISHSPTVADSKTSDGPGTGEFVSAITKLNGLTTYYVRAYATNSAGTGYGEELSFTTLVSLRIWNVPGDYVAASYPGSTYADWSPGSSPQVKSTADSPDNVEGYVYMSMTTNTWKIATQADWNGTNYGAGAVAGTLDAAGGDITLPAGYYKININAAATPMTYTAVATVWGIVGAATPGGWDTDTELTYNPATATWNLGVHLTVEAFKFRANNAWTNNYGGTAGDPALTAGGGDIANALEGDYAITLDLSHPNAYTYSADMWGIIGSATAGGWDADQNMTWDAVNKRFTATIDLTAGAIKFRANDAWTVNLGGDLSVLTAGGGDIAITNAGNYTVTLDPWAKIATLTAN